MFKNFYSLAFVILLSGVAHAQTPPPPVTPISTGFDIVSFGPPGDDLFAESEYSCGTTQCNFTYTVRFIQTDFNEIEYDWQGPGFKGFLNPIRFDSSDRKYDYSASFRTVVRKTGTIKFTYHDSQPRTLTGTADYHTYSVGTLNPFTPQQLQNQGGSIEHRSGLRSNSQQPSPPQSPTIAGDQAIADDLEFGFITRIEAITADELLYSYTVVNNTDGDMPYEWTAAGMVGTLDPMTSVSHSFTSSLAAVEEIGTAKVMFDGGEFQAPATVFRVVPEPCSLAVLLAVGPLSVARRRVAC